mmetsp:Transcript_31540/g.80430  ORF Transcript_31540/g.80430 Transcript_31540/m.80430 type:complete len:388 (-) Transcript_31540:510-1673(-)
MAEARREEDSVRVYLDNPAVALEAAVCEHRVPSRLESVHVEHQGTLRTLPQVRSGHVDGRGLGTTGAQLRRLIAHDHPTTAAKEANAVGALHPEELQITAHGRRDREAEEARQRQFGAVPEPPLLRRVPVAAAPELWAHPGLVRLRAIKALAMLVEDTTGALVVLPTLPRAACIARAGANLGAIDVWSRSLEAGPVQVADLPTLGEEDPLLARIVVIARLYPRIVEGLKALAVEVLEEARPENHATHVPLHGQAALATRPQAQRGEVPVRLRRVEAMACVGQPPEQLVVPPLLARLAGAAGLHQHLATGVAFPRRCQALALAVAQEATILAQVDERPLLAAQRAAAAPHVNRAAAAVQADAVAVEDALPLGLSLPLHNVELAEEFGV